MKTIACLLALSVASAALGATGAPASQADGFKPITPVGDCMKINQINEWHIVDARTAIVRTGPKRYRIGLQNDCPRLAMPPTGLVFRASASNQAVGENRICGDLGETVRSQQQPPCAIQSATLIDKAEFDRLAKQSKRSGSGADQPPARP